MKQSVSKLVYLDGKNRPSAVEKNHVFGPEHFSFAVLQNLIRAAGKWKELAPGLEARINRGGIEMRTHDGREPKPFLLR